MELKGQEMKLARGVVVCLKPLLVQCLPNTKSKAYSATSENWVKVLTTQNLNKLISRTTYCFTVLVSRARLCLEHSLIILAILKE